MTRLSSRKVDIASKKSTPCFARLAFAFSRSHSNWPYRTVRFSIYETYTISAFLYIQLAIRLYVLLSISLCRRPHREFIGERIHLLTR